MTKKKILFVTYGGGHVNMIIPVVKALEKNYKHVAYPIVIGATEAKASLETAGIDALSMYDFVNKKSKTAISWGKKLIDDQRYAQLPYTETVSYLGLNYVNLIENLGEEEAERLYHEKGEAAFLPIELMLSILMKIKPDLVVATNAGGMERAAFTAAEKLNIPSLCLVDLFAKSTPWVYENGFADKLCVFSSFVRKDFIEKGRDKDDIVITGNPGFDSLFDLDIDLHAERMRFKKNWRNKKVLLWDSQPEPERHPDTNMPGDPNLPKRIDKHMINMMTKHPDWQLVIRTKSRSDIDVKELPLNVDIATKRDYLPFLLRAVDAVVVLSARSGLQAALMNKPVYQIQGSVFYDDMPLDRLGYAIAVPSYESFESIFFDPTQALSPTFPFENATPKVVNVMVEVLQIKDLQSLGIRSLKQTDAAPLQRVQSK